jgi:methylmalonyl-CoA mutase C-terminal domain/subunit
MSIKKMKVLIAKPGLDGHESGAKLVAHALAEAGMEVIYSGPRQTPQMIVDRAVTEKVDLVGLSILSGTHKELCSRIITLLKEKGINNLPIILGGIIPESDISQLKKIGITEIFGPGTSTTEIVHFVENLISKKQANS